MKRVVLSTALKCAETGALLPKDTLCYQTTQTKEVFALNSDTVKNYLSNNGEDGCIILMKNHFTNTQSNFMCKKQPQFNIESYENENGHLIVTIERHDLAFPAHVDKAKFEWWLRLNDKLEWTMTTSDHTGEPQHFSGTMSLDEYWELGYNVKEDLYEYMQTNQVEVEGAKYGFNDLLLLLDIKGSQNINITPLPRWEHDQEI